MEYTWAREKAVSNYAFMECLQQMLHAQINHCVTNVIDKYDSKHTGSRTNVQANIEGTYGQMRTDGLYRQEGTNGVYKQEGKE